MLRLLKEQACDSGGGLPDGFVVRGNQKDHDAVQHTSWMGLPVAYGTLEGSSRAKSQNQDAYLIAQTQLMDFYGVFDGHGSNGHTASMIASKALPEILAKSKNLVRTPGRALQESFRVVHERFLKDMSRFDLSGTTATVVIELRRGRSSRRDLHVASVGDSRAVLGLRCRDRTLCGLDGLCPPDAHSRSTGARPEVTDGPGASCLDRADGLASKDLTTDHRPDAPREKERIEAFGGVVRLEEPCSRVYVRNTLHPGLAMTRSLGDHCAHTVGVTCEPEISFLRLKKKHQFLIIGSDGLWDEVSSCEAVDLVAGFGPQRVDCAVRELIQRVSARAAASEHPQRDDITIVVVWLNHPILDR